VGQELDAKTEVEDDAISGLASQDNCPYAGNQAQQ
jgi:hypothetical protein